MVSGSEGERVVNKSRRAFLKTMGAAVCATVVGGYEYGKQIEAGQPVVERVEIPLKNLGGGLEGFRLVQLSDIHLHPYTQIDLVHEAVRLANSLNPDLVVLTGDYVLQSAESIFELAPVLATLEARYGIFTILGNHDLWSDAEVVKAGLKQARLPLLENRGITLTINGSPLYLAGVDDGWGGSPDLPAAMAGWQDGTPAILLAHEPDLADDFAADTRISLQLSGHSHGGQVRLPGIRPLILPHLGRKYDQGLYRVNETWLYTNRGLGLIAPIRINCPPEVTEITLVSV